MTKLDRDKVIRAALDLLNETGVEGLTTRKLAERLQVQQPALYWHFRNKRKLLDALAETMLTERHTRSLPRQGEDWHVFLKENARSFRCALLAYRDGARIHAGTRPSGSQSSAAEAQIRLLCEAGFQQGCAVRALMAVSHYTVGAVLEQQSGAGDAMARDEAEPAGEAGPSGFLERLVNEMAADGPDSAFEYGLDALIAGLDLSRQGRAGHDQQVQDA